jgi:hypothetical protein
MKRSLLIGIALATHLSVASAEPAQPSPSPAQQHVLDSAVMEAMYGEITRYQQAYFSWRAEASVLRRELEAAQAELKKLQPAQSPDGSSADLVPH